MNHPFTGLQTVKETSRDFFLFTIYPSSYLPTDKHVANNDNKTFTVSLSNPFLHSTPSQGFSSVFGHYS